MSLARFLIIFAAILCIATGARAQETTTPPAGPASSMAPLAALGPAPLSASGVCGSIDPEAATRAYLDELAPEKKARSDAYFEGGYWLQVCNLLYGGAMYILLLHTGLSARMRRLTERVRPRWLQPTLYWLQFMLATFVLALPLSVYQDWWRERKYGLSNLTLAGWFGEQGKGLLVGAVLGGLAVMAIYAVVRRVRERWWLWGAALSVALVALSIVISPVFIAPIFNSPKRLDDERVTAPILSLARANGISSGEVWEIDASKQTSRMSAHVSGLLGTQRITLNDNLLRRGSLPEIKAIMAHEIGHYVLNHVYKMLLELGLIIVAGFWVINLFFERLRARFAPRWQVQAVSDPAGLPLAALLFSAFMFVMTPVLNSIIRSSEQEADMFGLNAAGQPDGFARAALDLSEYRKMEPSALEEVIFYDHPSGRTRIRSAMRWKAEHPESWAIAMPPGASDHPQCGAVPR